MKSVMKIFLLLAIVLAMEAGELAIFIVIFFSLVNNCSATFWVYNTVIFSQNSKFKICPNLPLFTQSLSQIHRTLTDFKFKIR
jgi:hypothetical protein